MPIVSRFNKINTVIAGLELYRLNSLPLCLSYPNATLLHLYSSSASLLNSCSTEVEYVKMRCFSSHTHKENARKYDFHCNASQVVRNDEETVFFYLTKH